MKIDFLIPIVIIVGIGVLFFFPEPETNFLAYICTALFFYNTNYIFSIFISQEK
ncbi:MAG: hypothetical protein ABH837_01855 [bacterium]